MAPTIAMGRVRLSPSVSPTFTLLCCVRYKNRSGSIANNNGGCDSGTRGWGRVAITSRGTSGNTDRYSNLGDEEGDL